MSWNSHFRVIGTMNWQVGGLKKASGGPFYLEATQILVKLSLCRINYALWHEDLPGQWRYSTAILNLGTRWRWMVSFTPWLLNPWRNCHWYPLDRRLGGPQNWSGCCREKKNLFTARNWTLAIQPIAHCYADWAIMTPTQIQLCVL
jgi:hypothetical protein